MKKHIAAVIAAASVLAACGGPKKRDAPKQAQAPARVVAPINGQVRKLSDKPMTDEQVASYHTSVDQAMDRIPPALRVDFHKAFECQAAKNATLPPAQQIEMDGNWIVMKTKQLTTDKAAALAC